MNTKNPTPADFKNYKPKNDTQKDVVNFIVANYKGNDFVAFQQQQKDNDLKFFHTLLNYQLNIKTITPEV